MNGKKIFTKLWIKKHKEFNNEGNVWEKKKISNANKQVKDDENSSIHFPLLFSRKKIPMM